MRDFLDTLMSGAAPIFSSKNARPLPKHKVEVGFARKAKTQGPLLSFLQHDARVDGEAKNTVSEVWVHETFRRGFLSGVMRG